MSVSSDQEDNSCGFTCCAQDRTARLGPEVRSQHRDFGACLSSGAVAFAASPWLGSVRSPKQQRARRDVSAECACRVSHLLRLPLPCPTFSVLSVSSKPKCLPRGPSLLLLHCCSLASLAPPLSADRQTDRQQTSPGAAPVVPHSPGGH